MGGGVDAKEKGIPLNVGRGPQIFSQKTAPYQLPENKKKEEEVGE